MNFGRVFFNLMPLLILLIAQHTNTSVLLVGLTFVKISTLVAVDQLHTLQLKIQVRGPLFYTCRRHFNPRWPDR